LCPQVLFLSHPDSGEIVDVDRDDCAEDVTYEVHVEPQLDDATWNLMPVLQRLFTFEYASTVPRARQPGPT